jgi:TolA-binding protein
MQRFLAHVFLLTILAIGLSETAVAQASVKAEKTTPQVASKKYYAFAKAIVDNGTLIISNVQEVELEQMSSEELQKNNLLAFQVQNHARFMKLINTRFGKLVAKTRFPAGFNSVELFNSLEEAAEARDFAMKNKEKNLLQVPDFKLENKSGFEKLKNDIIIE